MAGPHTAPLSESRQRAIADALSDLPTDYCAKVGFLRAIHHEFQMRMAVVLEDSLNEHFARTPHDSLEERRALVKSVGEDLRWLGLAFLCPRTRRPAAMVVDTVDADHDATPRFRLASRRTRGDKGYTFTSRALVPWRLTADTPRIEPMAERYRKPRTSRDASLE